MRLVADELDRVKLMEILAPPKQASRQKKR
jgi:hypothetical protein